MGFHLANNSIQKGRLYTIGIRILLMVSPPITSNIQFLAVYETGGRQHSINEWQCLREGHITTATITILRKSAVLFLILCHETFQLSKCSIEAKASRTSSELCGSLWCSSELIGSIDNRNHTVVHLAQYGNDFLPTIGVCKKNFSTSIIAPLFIADQANECCGRDRGLWKHFFLTSHFEVCVQRFPKWS